MRAIKVTLVVAALALPVATATCWAESHRSLDRVAASISKDVTKNHSERDALNAVSVETGVPKPKLQEMLDLHSDAGAGGLMIACTIADYTKRDPNYYMDRRFHHKQSWDNLVAESHVPFEKVDERLSHLENFIHSNADRRTEIRR